MFVVVERRQTQGLEKKPESLDPETDRSLAKRENHHLFLKYRGTDLTEDHKIL